MSRTITDYVNQQGITAKITTDRGMQIDESQKSTYSPNGWEHHAYRVRLNRPDGTRTPTFDWMQGAALTESPEDQPDRILDNLISEAWSYMEARSFEEWAADFGYDTDSRKAEKAYRECGKVAEWLDKFLGGDLEEVATEYERL